MPSISSYPVDHKAVYKNSYMNTSGGPGRPLLILLVLLTISILLDRYLIAGLFPWISMLGALSPMIVFLDIPLRLPVIDCIPVAILFSLFFSILLVSNPGRYGKMENGDIGRRLSGLFGGVLILLVWMAAGGIIYFFAWSYLPREIRNGIDSFGIQMDIYNPYPGHETIHLRGSMLLLICFIIGSRSLVARAGIAIRVVPVKQPAKRRIVPAEEEAAPAWQSAAGREAAARQLTAAQEAAIYREAAVQQAVAAHQVAPMPLAKPVRPRAVATKVPVVAPLRVESFE